MSLCKYLRCNSIKVDGIISIFLCSSGSSPAEWTKGRRQDVLEINPIKFLYVDWLYFICPDINQILDNQTFGLLHSIRLFPTSCFVGGPVYTSWFCNPFCFPPKSIGKLWACWKVFWWDYLCLLFRDTRVPQTVRFMLESLSLVSIINTFDI